MSTRSVTISTSLPQTNIKPTTAPAGGWTAAVPVANATTGNAVYVDTVAPAPPSLITSPSVSIGYGAGVTGTWGANSSYLWNFSASGYSTNGTFDPGAISAVTNQYSSPAISGGSQEHAYIHLKDTADGADATGNLYVRFHNQWENLVPDTANPYTQETWSQAGIAVQNLNATPITPTFEQTITGTITLQAAFTGGFSVANLLNLGATFTPSFAASSSGATTVPGPSIPQGEMSTPTLYAYYHRINDQVDEYGTTGYLGTLEESYDSTTPMQLAIGWSLVQQIPQ